MKNANGMGTVVRRKGVRKPYLVYSAAELVEGGKYKRRYLGSYSTRKEAEEVRMKNYFEPIKDADLVTFAEVYAKYTESSHYKTLSVKTRSNYEGAYKKAISLHNVRMRDIRTQDMQIVLDREAEEGRSRASQELIRALFSLLFKQALRDDIVKKDYSAFLSTTIADAESKRAFTDLEMQKIFAAAQTDDTAALVVYLIYTGWRVSEMVELTPFAYDPRTKCFTGGKKTAAGKGRTVPTHPAVQYIVDRHLAMNGPCVFCKPNGRPYSSSTFRNAMRALMERIGVDPSLTPHTCRHTFSTLAKRGGMDEFYRRAILGHTQTGVTDQVYTHASPEDLMRAVTDCHTFPNVINPSSTRQQPTANKADFN